MYWNCCPNCGNIFGLTSGANSGYCPKCDSFFTKNAVNSNTTTAPIENSITVANIPTAANAAREFYYVDKDYANVPLPEENSLTINAKSITINDGKISVTIDKDGIDKFYIIKINGIKFVQSDVEENLDEISHEYNQLVEKIYDVGLEKEIFGEEG